MRQINIDMEIEGYDGIKRSWTKIENDFKRKFAKGVILRLSRRINNERKKTIPDKDKIAFLKWCKRHTKEWLVAKPAELKMVKDEVDLRFSMLLEDAEFNKKVSKAYGYDHKKLLDLANWLNVKTCPYCNMQYTLYAKAYEDQEKMDKVAKFQFDHFYPQSKYPMLSMSLYNLIPSCASCNNGKMQGELSLEFHPYHASISDIFHFRVAKPLKLCMGSNEDVPKIEMVANTGVDISKYNWMFHIETLYQRHKDIVREVFTRAYADTYYNKADNFGFLKDGELKDRLRKGFYSEEKDISKRPLTKLSQDLWAQAKGIMK